MNNNIEPDVNNQPTTNRSKQIIFIIVIYILLVLSSRFGNKNQTNYEQKLINAIRMDQIPKLSVLFGVFQANTIYLGKWDKINNNSTQVPLLPDTFQFQNQGKSKIQFTGATDNQLNFGLIIENGQYIDDGYLYAAFNFKNQDKLNYFDITRSNQSSLILTILAEQNNTLPTATYKIEHIFNTLQLGVSMINKIMFNFTLLNDNSLQISTEIKTVKFSIKSSILGKQSYKLRTITFAFLVFIIAYFSFNSVLKILRRILQGSQQPQRYSLVTVLVSTLWDSVLCLVCFVQAFKTEQNLVLFIVPSFIFCILFTNLELRWMLSIFQSSNSTLIMRSMICRFNIISYGSFLLIYPILLLTNLNSYLFIGISLLFVPQIYVNAQKGIRPDLNHPYYSKFLMFRFAIIFYARGFPYNIFQLKPNYMLCLICLILISLQYVLLWVQKVYGPKKVLPAFLLPPVFNYKLEQEFNIELAGDIPQCAICITALHQDSDIHNAVLMKNEYDDVKLMKTPCNHKYHSQCLIQWMKIKKQCPQCRTSLPPFQ